VAEKGFREVKPGLWEQESSPRVVKIGKEFAEQAFRELETGSEIIDRRVKTVISEVEEASAVGEEE